MHAICVYLTLFPKVNIKKIPLEYCEVVNSVSIDFVTQVCFFLFNAKCHAEREREREFAIYSPFLGFTVTLLWF